MTIGKDSNAGGASRIPSAPKLKRMDEWNVGPIWAWGVGALVVVGIFIFACNAVYQSSHANVVTVPSSAAGARDTDTDNIPTGPRLGPTATSTAGVGVPAVPGQPRGLVDSKGRPTD